MRDDGVGRERGQVSGGLLIPLLLLFLYPPFISPRLQQVTDRSPHYRSSHCRAASERCDQAGGSQLTFRYSSSFSPIAHFHSLLLSLSLSSLSLVLSES